LPTSAEEARRRQRPEGSRFGPSWPGGAGAAPGDEGALATRVAELQEDYARLEAFAAIAAHELSEPLVTAETYATLLRERLGPRVDDQSRRELDALARTASRLRLVVETLLHEARCTHEPLPREPVALDDVLDDCLSLLAHEIAVRQARLVVRPLPTVRGDSSMLGIVLKNLFSNALRYGPRRGAVIRAGASRTKDAWRISIVSEGKTIPKADRKRIFAPFERGEGERRTVGTGLGLAISRSIVERHGGAIGAEPCPGGNRFFFTLPD
jgi:signal transduction histidine kinase